MLVRHADAQRRHKAGRYSRGRIYTQGSRPGAGGAGNHSPQGPPVTQSAGVLIHGDTSSVLRAFDKKLAEHRFAHAARHRLSKDTILFDSYHCSRYNLNTRRLTQDMFRDVFLAIKSELDKTSTTAE